MVARSIGVGSRGPSPSEGRVPSARSRRFPMRSTCRAAAAMGAILLLASCGMEPSEPCPTDDALIAYLDTQRAELERLVANPWDEELRSATKVLRVEPGADGRVELWMWHHDFPGPGGVTKGYVHGEAPTRPLAWTASTTTRTPAARRTRICSAISRGTGTSSIVPTTSPRRRFGVICPSVIGEGVRVAVHPHTITPRRSSPPGCWQASHARASRATPSVRRSSSITNGRRTWSLAPPEGEWTGPGTIETPWRRATWASSSAFGRGGAPRG